MPPFGGPTRHGFVLDDETRAATRSTFRAGHVEVEVDASYVTDDLPVLAVVERQRGLVGDPPSRIGPSASRSCSDMTADSGGSCTGMRTRWFTRSGGMRSLSSHGASCQTERLLIYPSRTTAILTSAEEVVAALTSRASRSRIHANSAQTASS